MMMSRIPAEIRANKEYMRKYRRQELFNVFGTTLTMLLVGMASVLVAGLAGVDFFSLLSY